MFNPLKLRLGQSVRIDDDPFTEGLPFVITGLAAYTVRGPNWTTEFLDVAVEAPCTEFGNEYAADGKVCLTVRVLPVRGRFELVLLWEEARSFTGDILRKAGQARINHAFGDGPADYERFAEQTQAPFQADVLTQRLEGGRPKDYTTQLATWTYSRPWQPVEGADTITQYLIVERDQSGSALLRRGYDMAARSFRV